MYGINKKYDESFVRRFDMCACGLGRSLSRILLNVPEDVRYRTQEIQIRRGKPLVLYCGDESFFVKDSGAAVKYASDDIVRISEEDIGE